jgi:aminocarboxymuconate-semialdehyde decarboxylase
MIDLDVHAHLIPIRVEPLARIPGVEWRPQDGALLVDGHRIGIAALFDPKQLISWMDESSVRRTLVSIPPPLYRQHLSRPAAAEWVRYLNSELLSLCEASEGRLAALFYIPLEHPDLIPELLEQGTLERFAGVTLAAGGHLSIEYWRDHYGMLWEWLNDAGAFTFLHPGTCQDCRLGQFYMENLVGNPYETAIAATHLIMAGVPSRYPRIRFCLAHAGGAFPAIVGRLQHGFDTGRPGINPTVEPPILGARRFFADGIAHHPGALELAEDVFGKNHILFGSDWPFPMGMIKHPAIETQR